jgi:hypothetical protein
MARISTGRVLIPWKHKVHDLRMIVAGDFSRVDPESPPQVDPADDSPRRGSLTWAYDALVRDYEEGTSNKMLQAIRTLVMQASYRFPTVEFEGVEPIEADIMASYVRRRLGPRPAGCDVMHHMRLALLDYIIGGIGWIWCGVDEGRPRNEAQDTLDVVWDQTARLITDIQWQAVRVREPLWRWVEMYGEKPFQTDLVGVKPNTVGMDKILELWFYYDVYGENGNHMVLRANEDDGATGDPIDVSDNPHTMDVDGIERPFLPLEPMYHLLLPSVRQPVSIAEMMLPNQLATRLSEREIRETVKRGRQFYDVESGAYDEETLEKFRQGELGAIVVRKKGQAPAEARGGIEISESLMEYWRMNDQELVAHSGANPYATGDKVNGIQFASEVNAIQSSAGLTVSTITGDHGAHYERMILKTIANAKKYDVAPLELTYDDVTLEFGPARPIGEYLRGDAVVKISEEMLHYESRERKMQRAQGVLNSAMAVAAIVGPQTVKLAYEDYLRAAGIRNVSQHLRPPEQPMMGPGGMPADPSMGAPAADDSAAVSAAAGESATG